jgi:hypothetical protein
MGSQSFTTYSRGKNVNDAYNRAVEAAEHEYGHQDGYSGQINSSAGFSDMTREFRNSKKSVSLEQFIDDQLDNLSKFDGARAICIDEPVTNSNKIKSQVEHIVTPGTKKWVLTYIVYCGGSRIASAITKGDAVKRAREYSEKNQCTTTIRMERRLEKDAHAVVAKVTYKRSSQEKEGRWVFFGWASC